MAGMLQEKLEARYAKAVCGMDAHFLPAKHVPDALAKLGLIGPEDHLVVYADDFQDTFLERFPRESLFFACDPTVDAFTEADQVAHRAAIQGASEQGRAYWFVNAIGGRGLRVPNLRVLSAAAHVAGVLLIVDNTVPSLFGCRPLELGADLCFEALDRVAAGELDSKTVAMAVSKKIKPPVSNRVCKNGQFGASGTAEVGQNAHSIGAVSEIESKDLAAIERGLDSLPVRMQRHFDHARALAEYLSCCDVLPGVAYPGLKTHPDHAVAANVLQHGFGPAVDFELPAPITASDFIVRCALNGRGHRAGGPFTRMAARDGDDARFIRLFAGLDDPLAIADDLDQAMRWFCNPPEP